MESLTKNDLRNMIKTIDEEIYRTIIIYSDKDDNIHPYYTEIVGKSDEWIATEIINQGNTILTYIPISNAKNWTAKEENRYLHNLGKSLEDKALKFARIKHAGQYRKNSNEEYVNHPIRVANLIKHYKSNSKDIEDLICAAFLHDTLEDTDTTFEEIVTNFNVEIAYLVKELTTDKNLKNILGKDKYLAYKCLNMSSWALDIKLCDRLDNIKDLNYMDEAFKNKYYFETIYIINFLIENADLTNTQWNIIYDIVKCLNKTEIDTKKLVKLPN